MSDVLIRERRGIFETYRRVGHVKMKTEVGLMHLHTKQCQGLLTDTRNQKTGLGSILPQSLQRKARLTMPHLDFRGLASKTVMESISVVLF